MTKMVKSTKFSIVEIKDAPTCLIFLSPQVITFYLLSAIH